VNSIREVASIDDQMFAYVHEDPVRPHIPAIQKIQSNKKVFYLSNQNYDILAMVCVAFCDAIATTEFELNRAMRLDTATVCMLYSVWSYDAGSGKELALALREYLKVAHPSVTRIMTLSPKTKTAVRFHTKNGAVQFQENKDTINFEYLTN
jgi:hypothetical protein